MCFFIIYLLCLEKSSDYAYAIFWSNLSYASPYTFHYPTLLNFTYLNSLTLPCIVLSCLTLYLTLPFRVYELYSIPLFIRWGKMPFCFTGSSSRASSTRVRVTRSNRFPLRRLSGQATDLDVKTWCLHDMSFCCMQYLTFHVMHT